MACSDVTETSHGRDGNMAGGSELRLRWDGGYNMGASEWREGKHNGAHRDAEEEVSELGEVLAALNRPEASSALEVEDDGGGDVAGAPAVRFSVRRKRWSRRISLGRR